MKKEIKAIIAINSSIIAFGLAAWFIKNTNQQPDNMAVVETDSISVDTIANVVEFQEITSYKESQDGTVVEYPDTVYFLTNKDSLYLENIEDTIYLPNSL